MNVDKIAEALALVARSLEKLEASVGEVTLNQEGVASRLTALNLTVEGLQGMVERKDAKAEIWQRETDTQIEALQKCARQ